MRFSERYSKIMPYVPGEQPQDRGYIKLNTNESPYPPSPKAVAAVDRERLSSLRLYSDPEATAVTEAIADYYGISFENVLATNGSDEALAFLIAALCDDKNGVVVPEISYGFYPVLCGLLCIKCDLIPLKSDYKVDVKSFCGINKNIVIANPNAPTGIAITAGEVEKIVASNPDNAVIIDEAYMDFGCESAVPLLGKYDNLIIVSTFSKSRSLAGGRLGYILASRRIIDEVKKIKYSFNPYNINRLTDIMGKYAIEDKEYFSDCVQMVTATREEARARLDAMSFETLPSQANFLFTRREGISGEELYLRLKEKGVLVRHFKNDKICDFVRVSVGSPADMQVFFEKLTEIVGEL